MKTKTTTIFTLTVIISLIIAGICANYPFFLTQYAGFFSKSTASKGADALVVLTGPKGVMINRIPHALELYRHGYSQLILIPEERQPNLAIKKYL
jgi:hypothetical protein